MAAQPVGTSNAYVYVSNTTTWFHKLLQIQPPVPLNQWYSSMIRSQDRQVLSVVDGVFCKIILKSLSRVVSEQQLETSYACWYSCLCSKSLGKRKKEKLRFPAIIYVVLWKVFGLQSNTIDSKFAMSEKR